ncbi:DMT family transporter [Halocynthiibacter sp. C4]|uniref:DMT family transporter n=1 Tax=Halocynthiibacter sp. C4 TaxID=2992758 RepID=UPI00237A8B97|nr:DMT family transporter [Halocynthiibacter sp. C4]MDE0590279.1 DMT family transporter [Halocynthiibacter sp. C4]
MKLILLTALTMVAFAANSVLNRLALADQAIDPASFAAIRIAAGALVLWLLVQLRKGVIRFHLGGVVSLAAYTLGFSFAYVSLDTGVGALILFGGVQVTMFLGALVSREALPPARWVGAGVAFAGLMVLVWPGGAVTISPVGAGLMAAAAVGWGVYSLIGKGASDALANTASNFIFALPFGLVALLIVPELHATGSGVVLAVISGAVTSGLGYALWYAILPRMSASIAAIVMLTVPVIATAGGVIFLGENVGLRFATATVLVLGGVLIAAKPART